MFLVCYKLVKIRAPDSSLVTEAYEQAPISPRDGGLERPHNVIKRKVAFFWKYGIILTTCRVREADTGF